MKMSDGLFLRVRIFEPVACQPPELLLPSMPQQVQTCTECSRHLMLAHAPPTQILTTSAPHSPTAETNLVSAVAQYSWMPALPADHAPIVISSDFSLCIYHARHSASLAFCRSSGRWPSCTPASSLRRSLWIIAACSLPAARTSLTSWWHRYVPLAMCRRAEDAKVTAAP